MAKNTGKRILLAITVGIISIMTFALWNLINTAVEDLLLWLGITNSYAQFSAIFVGGLLLIMIVYLFVRKKFKLWNILKDVFQL